MTIQWLTDSVGLPEFDYSKLELWLQEVAASHDRLVGELTYIFCNDAKILEVNLQYLQHDYYTDIITFDYSRGRLIRGDMFISLDTVQSNSVLVSSDYCRELLRVIVHGVLHLCGINDKGEGEREIMESFENKALDLYYSKFAV